MYQQWRHLKSCGRSAPISVGAARDRDIKRIEIVLQKDADYVAVSR